jgi:hypothetical protein
MSHVSTTVRTARRSCLVRCSTLCVVLRFAVPLCVCIAPGRALAQASSTEKAVAESLFLEGKALMTDGRFAEACPKLEQSQSIEGAIGTMLYLAECYEKTQRLASAWAMFREASSRARAEGQPDRAKVGDDRAKLIEPLLSKLTVLVSPENQMPELRLALDGHPLPLSLRGTPIPVDAGEHTLSAEAPGYEPFSIKINVTGPSATGTAEVPVLTPLATPQAPAETRAVPAASTTSPPADDGRAQSNAQEIVGLAVAGVGLVGVGVGVYFGLEARKIDEEAEGICPRDEECNAQRGLDLTDDAQGEALKANILYGVGGALLIAGAVLYFTADDPSEAKRGSYRPLVTVGSARLYPDAVFTPTFSGISLDTEF